MTLEKDKNPKPKPRRFIAGAVCPRCAQMDKIVLYEEAGRQIQSCVSCGFEQVLDAGPGVQQKPESVTQAPTELPTRVTPKAEPEKPEQKDQADVQVIKFIDATNPGKDQS